MGFEPERADLEKALAGALPKKKAKFVEIQFCQEWSAALWQPLETLTPGQGNVAHVGNRSRTQRNPTQLGRRAVV